MTEVKKPTMDPFLVDEMEFKRGWSSRLEPQPRSETFNEIKYAILLREKLIESTYFDNVRIEVSYDLEKEKSWILKL